MSDSPNSSHAQSIEAANAAATPNRSHGVEFKLSDYQWQNRILLVFAPSTDSSQYRQQMQAWQADAAGTNDRDLKLVQILGNGDGTEKQRSQAPIDLAMLFRTIDAMPMRQQEMRSHQ
ncbi:MAG: DUF4174 domain-containing protein [Kovacikia sp.]